jgi:hypothetical protein
MQIHPHGIKGLVYAGLVFSVGVVCVFRPNWVAWMRIGGPTAEEYPALSVFPFGASVVFFLVWLAGND